MNGGSVPHRSSCAARTRRTTLPKAAKFAEGVREGAVQGVVLELPRRNDASCATSCCRTITALESWGDAEPVRGTLGAAAAGDGSGVQHARHGRRAARRGAEPIHAMAAAVPVAPTIATGSSSRYPAARRRSPRRWRRDMARDRALARAAHGRAPRRAAARPIAGDGRLLPRRLSVAGARRRRGANKPWLQELPDPVTQDLPGSRGSRSIRRPRRGSASSAATTSR